MSAARMAGALLLVCCGWCAGDAVRSCFAAHEDALRSTVRLLRRVRQEIACRRADLNLLCAKLRREGVLPRQCRALCALAPPPELTQREAECFAECVSALGHAPAEQECERLDYYILRFEEFLSAAQAQTRQSAALCRRLGLAAGAVAALFVI